MSYSRNFKTSIQILCLVFLASCVRGPNRPSSTTGVGSGIANQATDFRIAEIQGQATEEMASETWKVVDKKDYSLRVCITTLGPNSQVGAGLKFSVGWPDGSRKHINTDTDGCLVWNETVKFDMAADSMYLEKVRTIKGRGIYQGSTPVRIGLNPWASIRGEVVKEIIDLNRVKIPENRIVSEKNAGLYSAGLYRHDSSRKLLIKPNIDFNVSRDADLTNGAGIDVTLRVNPYIEPRGLSGRKVPFYLLTGEYEIRVQLVGRLKTKNGSELKTMLLAPALAPKLDTLDNNNVLKYQMTVPLNRRWVRGNVRVALKITPKNAPFDLEPYEALHDMGKFSELFSGRPPVQKEGPFSNKAFHYAKYIKSTENFEDMKKQGWAKDLPPVEFSAMKPRFKRIQSGETATRRTIIYQVTTQVLESVSTDPIPNAQFFVETPFENMNGTEENPGQMITTDAHGFLNWDASLTHVYYKQERYFFPHTFITDPASGYRFEAKLAINPWDYGWTFGHDLRTFDVKKQQEIQDLEVRESLFMVDAFRYQTIRFRYEIDEFMTLNVKKAVVMTFDPLAQRFAIGLGRKFEPLRDGIYLVKLALVKNFIDPFLSSTRLMRDEENGRNIYTMKKTSDFDGDHSLPDEQDPRKGQYTDIVKKLVRVQAGRITSPVEFSMRDLRMMSIRSALMVQIETIDERKLMSINLADKDLRDIEGERKAFKTFKESLAGVDEPLKQAAIDRYLTEKDEERLENLKKLQEWAQEARRQAEHERNKVASFMARQAKAMDKVYQKSIRKEGATTGGEQDADSPVGFADRRDSQTKDIIPQEVENYVFAKREELDSELIAEYQLYKDRIDQMDRLQAVYNFTDRLEDDNIEDESKKQGKLFRKNLNMNDETFNKLQKHRRDRLHTILDNLDERSREWEGKYQAAILEKDENGLYSTPVENSKPHYQHIDYLASLQTFIDEGELGLPVTFKEKDTMLVNNYTILPAVPFVDLNFLREDSGLKKRTFIGPCTLVENQNLSDMRPTNTIDEAYSERIDSSDRRFLEVDPEAQPFVNNDKFEKSKFHDSLTAFRNKHVDDFIEDHNRNEAIYRRTMKILKTKKNVIDTYNLKYVSLDNSSMDAFVESCDFENQGEFPCFKNSREGQIGLSDFNTQFWDKTNRELLETFYCLAPKFLDQPAYDEMPSGKNYSGDKAKQKTSGRNGLKTFADIDSCRRQADTNNFVEGIGRSHFKVTLDDNSLVENFFYNLLSEKRPLKINEAMRFCNIIAKQTSQGILNDLEDNNKNNDFATSERGELERLEGKVFTECARQIERLDPDELLVESKAFFWTPRYRVLQTGQYVHNSGKNMNISIGKNTYIGYEKEAGVAGTYGGGLSSPIPFLSGNIGGSVVTTDGIATGVGTSIDRGTYLVVQKASMTVEIKNHEKCATLQMNPSFVKKFTQDFKQHRKEVEIDKSSIQTHLSKGFFICEGNSSERKNKDLDENENKNKDSEWINENYYYLTQHFTAGEMLDDANLLNHVWLLALRGKKDFTTFSKLTNAEQVTIKGTKIAEAHRDEYPLYRLGSIYEDVIPSIPGFYSFTYFPKEKKEKKEWEVMDSPDELE